jgi:hypothetical protein
MGWDEVRWALKHACAERNITSSHVARIELGGWRAGRRAMVSHVSARSFGRSAVEASSGAGWWWEGVVTGQRRGEREARAGAASADPSSRMWPLPVHSISSLPPCSMAWVVGSSRLARLSSLAFLYPLLSPASSLHVRTRHGGHIVSVLQVSSKRSKRSFILGGRTGRRRNNLNRPSVCRPQAHAAFQFSYSNAGG